MLQATKNKYGIETLKTLNVLYDHEHWLTQEDVDMANRYVELIEQTRSEITPQTGDRLIYLSRHTQRILAVRQGRGHARLLIVAGGE